MQKDLKSIAELRAFAEKFLRLLAARELSARATVVGLSGDLGAGKTAFVKCVADALGIKETITSPTFILEKIYIVPRGSLIGPRFTKLIHIDAYRLRSADEMRALDWEAVTATPANLIFIEWPEQVDGALPVDAVKLSFEYVDEKTRRVSGAVM